MCTENEKSRASEHVHTDDSHQSGLQVKRSQTVCSLPSHASRKATVIYFEALAHVINADGHVIPTKARDGCGRLSSDDQNTRVVLKHHSSILFNMICMYFKLSPKHLQTAAQTIKYPSSSPA